jgi:hypothetical protein
VLLLDNLKPLNVQAVRFGVTGVCTKRQFACYIVCRLDALYKCRRSCRLHRRTYAVICFGALKDCAYVGVYYICMCACVCV